MDVTRKQLRFVPIAMLAGGAIFAAGHSMRVKFVPGRMDAGASDDVSLETTSPTVSRMAAVTLLPVLMAEQVPVVDQGADGAQVRTGTIVSMNGEFFILRDNDHDTWYHLDDQRAAASYLGKKVQVRGDVDPATDVIHVQEIQEKA